MASLRSPSVPVLEGLIQADPGEERRQQLRKSPGIETLGTREDVIDVPPARVDIDLGFLGSTKISDDGWRRDVQAHADHFVLKSAAPLWVQVAERRHVGGPTASAGTMRPVSSCSSRTAAAAQLSPGSPPTWQLPPGSELRPTRLDRPEQEQPALGVGHDPDGHVPLRVVPLGFRRSVSGCSVSGRSVSGRSASCSVSGCSVSSRAMSGRARPSPAAYSAAGGYHERREPGADDDRYGSGRGRGGLQRRLLERLRDRHGRHPGERPHHDEARPITLSAGTVPPPGSPRCARESADAAR